MAKIYTRAGDAGETVLGGGSRVRKDDVRVEAYGAVDELNAVLGVVRAELAAGSDVVTGADELLARLQHQLFDLGAELANPRPAEAQMSLLGDGAVAVLEVAIDGYEAQLEPLREFILPGGTRLAAELHRARCVCRRAERRIVHLAAEAPVRDVIIRYVNRLSDLLFVLARSANRTAGVPDTTWTKGDT